MSVCGGRHHFLQTAGSSTARTLGMVLAHPAEAQRGRAVMVMINHWTSLTGRRLYASIAQFESSILRRSPRLIMLAMLSNRNREVSLGSPSSPVLSRTLQAMLKDCSKRSVSVILGKQVPRRNVPTRASSLRVRGSPKSSTSPTNVRI